MKGKNLLVVLATLTMILSLLGGCGKKTITNNIPSTEKKATETTSTEKNTNETININFWTAPNQGQYDFWESKAKAFNATNTKVNGKVIIIKVQQMPETPSSEAGIQNAIATGSAPAVSENISRSFAATLAKSGVVYDLSQEDWFTDVLKSRHMEEAVKNWAIDGKQYVLPIYVNPILWQWNMKGLTILGFNSAPETVDDLKKLMKTFAEKKTELKNAGITHSLYRPSLTRPDQYWDRWFDFEMIYNGISVGKTIVEGDKLTMDEQSAITAMEVIGTFGNTIQQGDLSNIWTDKTPSILVSINAPWDISNYRENNKVYGVDYVYGPSLSLNKGDQHYDYADSKGLTFYKAQNITQDEHQGAIEFVKWVYNADNSAQTDLDWLKTTTMLPVRGDLNENAVFTDFMKQYPELSELAKYVPYSIPGLATEKDPDIWTAFTESCTSPYMNEVIKAKPGEAPDATSYVEKGIKAMKDAGELK